jgi:predicted amidohydrolase
MSYAIGVIRVGEDDNGYEYTGHSQLVDYLGEYLIEPTEKEGILIATLDKSKCLKFVKA